ncbi:hypothetical protein O0Q50_23520 [Priestia aryabhattai]|uniref:HTH domain-containing protein n=1 Tax=Priestia aryabhattai TaxID=412384 RepID=A0AAX6NE33_PRIAR|nr:hypothetical protein [Priestia aryabhattai]MDU9694158.1 hypothetical protein [Priestia aryabhattai]
MLVKEVLNKIHEKELTIKELADLYGVSARTIEMKIKNLGYEWNNKQSAYYYTGTGLEPLNTNFSGLFSKANQKLVEQKQANSEIASASEGNRNLEESIANGELDTIDILLQSPKDRSKRVYRGFYFDNDVLNIIERVPKSYKSELVNEALRKVFKEKGLLD